jgi:uncharacterized membrane protein
MRSDDKRSANEIYCTSCGEIISKKAEICFECGVTNENRQILLSTSEPTNQSVVHESNLHSSNSLHDPSHYETTVSNSWWCGVVASIILWIIGFSLPEGSAATGLIILIAFALMPLSIYHDRKWVQATTTWEPDLNIWLIFTLTPLFNIVAGGIYLFRRYDTEWVLSPTANTVSDHVRKDAAIDEIHRRYVNDELTEEKFEAELEDVMRAKERSDVKQNINSR